MILIDTHIWIWWASNSEQLSTRSRSILTRPGERFFLSAISCWEVAKLVEYHRLSLDRPVQEWIWAAMSFGNLEMLPLTPEILVGSTQLPEPFHRDPADQIIVATARQHQIQLQT